MSVLPSSATDWHRRPKFAAASALVLSLVLAGLPPAIAGPVQDKLAQVRQSAKFERSYADLVEAVVPAVVFVEVQRSTPAMAEAPEMPPEMRRFFRRFFGPDVPFPEEPPAPPGPRGPGGPRTEAVGSGFIVSAQGHVVTNAHVARGAERIVVKLQDGRELQAQTVGIDDKTDLAVLKLPDDGPYPYVEFGDSDKVRVGDKVIAVGNPFGLGGTVTAGIVSATRREVGVGPYDDFLQIDAPINRGNSGGPTFDLDGNVIGVNTLIFSPSGGNVGIGFAIAANLAKQVVADLIEKGAVERGWLGIVIQPVDEDIARALELPAARGALVNSVQPGSPAEKAGLRPGDVVVALDGQPVNDPRDLARKVAAAGPGHRAQLAVVRDGKEQTFEIELGTMPATTAEGKPVAPTPAAGRLGLAVRPLLPEDREQLGLSPETTGVLVVSVEEDSPAAAKGIRPGDVIAAVDGRDVRAAEDLRKAIDAAIAAGKKVVLLRVVREDQPRFVAVPVERAGKQG
ncbi:Periplasmic serine endoprotease DegP [bacterium HR40]|nr:Periplasmic serine endoprotease DegP [bacterium HR40]